MTAKHFLTVSQSGALVGLRHEACPAGETVHCTFHVAWTETLRGRKLMPQPAQFEHYGAGEHEMELTIFGDLQGVNADIPWRQQVAGGHQ